MSKSKRPTAAKPKPQAKPRRAKPTPKPADPTIIVGAQLSVQQMEFCHQYIKCQRQGEAAIAAGYSQASADNIAYELMKKREILLYIQQLMDEKGMSYGETLWRISEHARADIREFIGMTPEQVKRSDRGWLIKKYRQTETRVGEDVVNITTEIELNDPLAALKLLAQKHSMLNQKIDVTSNGKPLADTRPVIILDFGGDDDDNGGIGGE